MAVPTLYCERCRLSFPPRGGVFTVGEGVVVESYGESCPQCGEMARALPGADLRAFNVSASRIAAFVRNMGGYDRDEVLRLLELAHNGTISLGEAVSQIEPRANWVSEWLKHVKTPQAQMTLVLFLVTLFRHQIGDAGGQTLEEIEGLLRWLVNHGAGPPLSR